MDWQFNCFYSAAQERFTEVIADITVQMISKIEEVFLNKCVFTDPDSDLQDNDAEQAGAYSLYSSQLDSGYS